MVVSVAQTDTLRNYALDAGTNYLNSSDLETLVLRYGLSSNVKVYGFQMFVNVTQPSRFVINIYGQEGGLAIPQLEEELVKPIVVELEPGTRVAKVNLETPLFLDTDQFFVSISELSGAIKFLTDMSDLDPSCVSKNGGVYSSTLYKSPLGNKLIRSYKNLKIDFFIDPLEDYAEVQFVNVTEEIFGAEPIIANSVSFADLNKDKILDVVIDSRIFYGNNNGAYDEKTRELRFPGHHKGIENLVLDMDNDGFLDIILFRGKASFVYMYLDEISMYRPKRLPIPLTEHLSSVSYADVNRDGYLDIFLGQTWSYYPKPAANYFLLNSGRSTFIDRTRWFYPDHSGINNFKKNTACDSLDLDDCLYDVNLNKRTKDCQFSDIDNDGDLDLVVANYFLEEDEYYEQQADGFFQRKNLLGFHQSPILLPPIPIDMIEEGISRGHHTTGIDIIDLDNDLRQDVILSQLAHPKYLKQYGHRPSAIYYQTEATAFEQSSKVGITFEETHAHVVTGDVNNDGREDAFLTTYYGCRYADLFLQNSLGRFLNVSNNCGLAKLELGDDACLVDYNQDGHLDIVTKKDGYIQVYKNQSTDNHNWVQLKLKDTQGNIAGIGCKVIVTSSSGISYKKEMGLVKGKLFQPDHLLHFGLGTDNIQSVTVHWTATDIEVFKNLEPNTRHLLERHKGE